MLRITVDVVPDGCLRDARTLAVGIVGRRPDHDDGDRRSYIVHLGPDGYRGDAKATVWHDPTGGPWRLVADAIAAALDGGRQPDEEDAQAAERAWTRAEGDVIKRLHGAGLAALGVTAADLARAGADADPARLAALLNVAALLTETLLPPGLGQWLRTPARLLDGRAPLDAIANGDADAVINATRAYVAGSYL